MAYALDLTASSPANYITTTHRKDGDGDWVIVPEGGAFYTKDLIITDTFTGNELKPIVDYNALQLIGEAVLESGGKEVCAVLHITTTRYIEVTIKRRVVGGPNYSVIGSDVQKLVDEFDLTRLNSSVWGQIIGRPTQFPPEMHEQYLGDIYGVGGMAYALGKIKSTIQDGDGAGMDMLYRYIDRRLADIEDGAFKRINDLGDEIDEYINGSKFKPNQIVIFADDTDPNVIYDGIWERLSEGVLMLAGTPEEIGKTSRLGEGPDYWGRRYAGWRYVGATIDNNNMPVMRFTSLSGGVTASSGSSFRVRNRVTDAYYEATLSRNTYTVVVPNSGDFEIVPDDILKPIKGVMLSGNVSEILSWHTGGYVKHDFQNFGEAELIFNAPRLTKVPTFLPATITTAKSMFQGATSFNQSLNTWDVSRITSFEDMFNGAVSFNQSLNTWGVQNAVSMKNMFNGATAFNQDITAWNVSKVTNMSGMFWSARAFDQDIGEWNVKSTMNMDNMFADAISFSRDISWWCVSNIITEPSGFAVSATKFTADKHPYWGTCPLPPSQVSISLTASSDIIYETTSTQLTVESRTPDFAINSITWQSSASNVATVTNSGVVTGVNGGVVIITALINGRYKQTISISVQKPIITVSAPESVDVTKTAQLKYVISPTGYKLSTAVWSTSNAGIMTVDQSGVVTAIDDGTATITLTINGKHKSSVTIKSNLTGYDYDYMLVDKQVNVAHVNPYPYTIWVALRVAITDPSGSYNSTTTKMQVLSDGVPVAAFYCERDAGSIWMTMSGMFPVEAGKSYIINTYNGYISHVTHWYIERKDIK